MDSREGAVLVADISGFTQLTETLSTREAAGVEILTKCMNGVFGRVIDVVRRYGGDVTRFAGDSVICAFWPVENEQRLPDGGLAEATLRGVQCAAALSLQLGTFTWFQCLHFPACPRTSKFFNNECEFGLDARPAIFRCCRALSLAVSLVP